MGGWTDFKQEIVVKIERDRVGETESGKFMNRPRLMKGRRIHG